MMPYCDPSVPVRSLLRSYRSMRMSAMCLSRGGLDAHRRKSILKMSTSSPSICSTGRMSPNTPPGLDIAQLPEIIPISGPESPSASTIISSDTIITPPSDLSSGESISSQPSSLPVKSTDASTPRSTETMGRFTRHKRFFFEDGNITFLVDDVLYCVHRYYFCRDSKLFKTRLSRFSAQEASSLSVISLDNVKSKDLDAFLSVLYPLDFNVLGGYSFEELSSILDLSTRWGFSSIRDMAIRCLNPPTPHQRLILGRKCGVDQWILPALQELCERPEPPTRDEARLMGLDDVILVGSVREKVRTHALTTRRAAIMDRIKAWGSVEPQGRPIGVQAPSFALSPPAPLGDLVEDHCLTPKEAVEPLWTRGSSPEAAAEPPWTRGLSPGVAEEPSWTRVSSPGVAAEPSWTRSPTPAAAAEPPRTRGSRSTPKAAYPFGPFRR